mmetsp:Transcript_132697/g.229663  ORF Transcript_132697/g.229663 Transcript_132697/m.229663 type:complete len:202 (+) Transcript_132697:1325-1930(+)
MCISFSKRPLCFLTLDMGGALVGIVIATPCSTLGLILVHIPPSQIILWFFLLCVATIIKPIAEASNLRYCGTVRVIVSIEYNAILSPRTVKWSVARCVLMVHTCGVVILIDGNCARERVTISIKCNARFSPILVIRGAASYILMVAICTVVVLIDGNCASDRPTVSVKCNSILHPILVIRGGARCILMVATCSVVVFIDGN